MKKRIPVFRKDQVLDRMGALCCAIREYTANGVSIGRCWHYVGLDYVCPIHGDVRVVQEHYLATGKLTADPRRG